MLLVDMNNLCMREAFAKVGLTNHGRPSGVIYGTLQQLRLLMGRFPGEIICCWDAPRKSLHRRQFWSSYKANREGKEPSEAAQDAYPQMVVLREELLPRLGLPNQFLQGGYEADDLIAYMARESYYWVDGHKFIIASSDNDLYQLLGPRVSVYDFGKKANYSWQNLKADHGVLPGQWVEVKAIAGDTSDGIDGVPGVGVKTAVKYLYGQAGVKAVAKVEAATDVIARNRKLITLPWPGCDPGSVRPSRFDEREFMQICAEWGIRSLDR